MWPIDTPPQWVDRTGELATLRAGIEALRDGGGAAVWVEGEPGIGKSSLVVQALAGASEGYRPAHRQRDPRPALPAGPSDGTRDRQ